MSDAAHAEVPLSKRVSEIIALSAALGAAFLIINFLHFQYITVSVILYACIWDALLASVIVFGAYAYLRRKAPVLLPTEFALTAAASNLLILLYSVMGPTVIDRSLSVYIVQKIDQRGGEVAEAAMPAIFVEEYMPEMRLVEVRMTEQLTSGTVVIEDGCVILTGKGRFFSGFADAYRKTLLPQKRLLMGEVTDQLTDPFRDAPQIVETACPDRS